VPRDPTCAITSQRINSAAGPKFPTQSDPLDWLTSAFNGTVSSDQSDTDRPRIGMGRISVFIQYQHDDDTLTGTVSAIPKVVHETSLNNFW
jgi:hypothetical protein